MVFSKHPYYIPQSQQRVVDQGTERPRYFVVSCKSLSEYVAAAVDATELEIKVGSPIIPLLDAESCMPQLQSAVSHDLSVVEYCGSSSFQAISENTSEATLQRCEELTNINCGSSAATCVAFASDRYALGAAVFALLFRKRLIVVDSVEALSIAPVPDRDSGSCSVVGSPAIFGSIGLDALSTAIRRRMASCISRPSVWGIITCSTLERLSCYIARLMLRCPPSTREGRFYWYAGSIAPTAVYDPELEVKAGRQIPGSSAYELSSTRVPFVLFGGHGRTYCSMEGNLCSRIAEASPEDDSCVQGLQCTKSEWPRIPASSLHADTVVVDSCLTVNFQSGLEAPLNIAIHLLDGHATAVISPYRTTFPLPFTPFYAWDMAKRGCTVGEICLQLNNAVGHVTGNLHPFVLMGDPELTIFSGLQDSPQLKAVKTGSTSWQLDIPPSDSGIDCYEAVEPDLAKAADTGQLYCEFEWPKESGLKGHVWHILEKGSVKLLVVKDQKGVRPKLRVGLTTLPPLRCEVVRIAVELTRNLSRTDSQLGVEKQSVATPGVWERIAREDALCKLKELLARNQRAITNSLQAPALAAAPYASLLMLDETIMTMCVQASHASLEVLSEESREPYGLWSYSLHHRSFGTRLGPEAPLDTPCPVCQGSMRRRVYSVGIFERGCRWLYECERCEILSDVPEGMTMPFFTGADALLRGLGSVVSLTVNNSAPHPCLVHSTVTVDYPKDRLGRFIRTPPTQFQIAQPGKQVTFNFNLIPSPEVRRSVYHAMGTILINGGLCWVRKYVNVV